MRKLRRLSLVRFAATPLLFLFFDRASFKYAKVMRSFVFCRYALATVAALNAVTLASIAWVLFVCVLKNVRPRMPIMTPGTRAANKKAIKSRRAIGMLEMKLNMVVSVLPGRPVGYVI